MPIAKEMKYISHYQNPEKEEDLLDLLKDVRISLIRLDNSFRSKSLDDMLGIIDSGKHIVLKPHEPQDIKIDFSEAYSFIKEYKEKSEGGCQSCFCREFEKVLPDEVVVYCGLCESETDVNEKTGYSPQISKYNQEGCESRRPFFRQIEEVLKEVGDF